MSDNDGLAGSSSSNGGGVSSDAGGVGAGQTTLSGAVEQADKTVRDSATSVIGCSDIDWNLFRDDLRRLADSASALYVTRLDFSFDQQEPAHFRVVLFRDLCGLSVPLSFYFSGPLDPAVAEDGDSQQDDSPDAYDQGLRC